MSLYKNQLDNNPVISGYTKLGSNAPAIRMAYYDMTMGSLNTSVTLAHGLSMDNIIGIQCCVLSADGDLVSPSNNDTTWFEVYITATNIVLYCGTNASVLVGRPARILLIYTD